MWTKTANNFPNLLFTLDSEGNRLSTTATQGGSSTMTTPGVNSAADQLTSESYNAGGATQSAQIDGSKTGTTLKFDAWGRVVSVQYAGGLAANGGSPDTLTQNFYYDALGREIATNTVDSNGVYVVQGSITYYDIGNNPIEEKPTDAAANAPSAEYVWSEAGPTHLIEKKYVYGMFFPITDAAGSVTAVVNTSGALAERYIYNCDGEVQAYSATWNPFAAGSSSGVTTSQIGWNILWHGMRYDSLFFGGERVPYTVSNPGVPASTYNETEATGGGFYFGTSGGGWYDPQHGRAIVPNPAAPGTSPYDPHAGAILGSTWWANHAAGVAAVSGAGLAIAATVLTAGALAPESAAAFGAAEAGSFEAAAAGGAEFASVAGAATSAGSITAAGAVGGAIGAGASSYAAGNALKRVALDATVGAVAGAAGAAAGSAVAAQFCPAAIEGWVASGVAGGAVGGGVQGGLEGYIDHGVNGIAAGALQGAVSGAAFGGIGAAVGYGVFRGLGLLDGYSCFVTGTPVLTRAGKNSIESVKVGRRMKTPLTKELAAHEGLDDSSAFVGWKVVELRMANRRHSGDIVDVTLLRPQSWVRHNGAEVGRVIRLVLEEMKIDGPAEVVSVADAPQIEPGTGQVVTGTFSHMAEDVVRVKLVGFDQPLDVTSKHRVYESGKDAFQPVIELAAGQFLRTIGGEVEIESVDKLAGSFCVHNLEVDYEHVYYVGDADVLVHNIYNNVAEFQEYKMQLLREEIANPVSDMSGPVVLNDPAAGATAVQEGNIREYASIASLAEREGYLSPTGRVSTEGDLRADASALAAAEKSAARNAGVPYNGVAAHGPDTTWTNNPQPFTWMDHDLSVNSSLGRQAQNYLLGYKPTRFVYGGDL